MKFYNTTECRVFLEKLCEEFELCPKYCHLQSNVTTCFHYQIKKCKGICKKEEATESYNNRVKKAISTLKFQNENFIIKESGRSKKEYGFVLIQNGIYKGFGYLNGKKEIKTSEEYLEEITIQKDNNDVKRILNYYLKNNESNLITIE